MSPCYLRVAQVPSTEHVNNYMFLGNFPVSLCFHGYHYSVSVCDLMIPSNVDVKFSPFHNFHISTKHTPHT